MAPPPGGEPVRVLAPGKLVIAGEYAVLDGCPAIVAAIDRGVGCEATPAPSGGRAIEAPDERFVGPALEAAGAPPGRYRFFSWNPVDLPGKPGFGGSAAATVAAVAAGQILAGRTPRALSEADRAAIERIAVGVHHAVQGSGSGIDVRAAARGGMRRFEDVRSTDGRSEALAGWPLLAVYSGASASTGPRVQRYQAWRQRDPGAADRFLDESRRIVDALPEDPRLALREAYALLQGMARAAGLDYDTAALARIASLAEARGGAAKPSGAGGGDVAVAWLPDPDARADFAAACAAAGLPPVPVRIVSGVTAEGAG